MFGAGIRIWSDGNSSKLDPEEWCQRILCCLLNEIMREGVEMNRIWIWIWVMGEGWSGDNCERRKR